jgi:hypothetical protein
MGILVDNVDFTVNGVTTPFYQANAGDLVTASMFIRTTIYMTSVGNPLVLNPSFNQVQSPGVSWLGAGFRPGQWCVLYVRNNGGSLAYPPFWSQLSYVDDVLADFGAMPVWYNITNSQYIDIYAVTGPNVFTALPLDEMDLLVNHVENGNPGSEFSLIDAEATRSRMTGIASLGVGGSVPGLLLGNQSGQFLKSVSIQRITAIDQQYRYRVDVEFVSSGMYDDAWFFSSGCLKTWLRTEWAVTSGEPFDRMIGLYNLDGNSGFYDEPYNTGVVDSSLVQGISEIDYCVPTTADIIVDGPTTNIQIGSCYLPIDSTYYKNQLESQCNLTMIVPSSDAVVTTYNSDLNPGLAGYVLTINSVTVLGSQTTINVTFTPNPLFSSFIDGRDPNDRRFLVWVKCGNINHLVHDAQLQCDPPIGGPLPMVQDYGYLHHGENIETAVGDLTGFIADTEDDVAYLGRFLLTKNNLSYESFTVRMEAYNTVTGDDFTLATVQFAFGSVPISGDGRFLLNESATVVTTLPTTSVKREATLELTPFLDTPTQYGVTIYAPWLLDWRYWLNQSGVNVDFYPNFNKDWEQYDNPTDWVLRTKLILIEDGLAYVHDNVIIDRPYDADATIISSIDLVDDATNNIVGVVPAGNLMRIVATHKNTLGAWDVPSTWGMITIEPYESDRRWICSTIVPFDNDSNNPLTPLTGLLCALTFPLPDVARMECYFDSNLIDLSNGVKITAKIYSGKEPIIGQKTTAPNDLPKTIETGADKTLAP